MTTDNMTYEPMEMSSAALLKMRREKYKERRRRQLDGFYRNLAEQNTDKIIFLFDTDLNIA